MPHGNAIRKTHSERSARTVGLLMIPPKLDAKKCTPTNIPKEPHITYPYLTSSEVPKLSNIQARESHPLCQQRHSSTDAIVKRSLTLSSKTLTQNLNSKPQPKTVGTCSCSLIQTQSICIRFLLGMPLKTVGYSSLLGRSMLKC